MLAIFDGVRSITFLSVLLRMAFAFACGAAIGLERSYKNRPAGFRTHILICVGAAAASMTGLFLYLNAHIPLDVSRIGASVVSGLGFIGAGTIIVTHNHAIHGLTTAAGLWVTGIIGLAIGAGYYEGGLAATVLILITELSLPRAASLIRYKPEFRLVLGYRNKAALDRVLRACIDQRLTITDLRVTGEKGDYHAVIALRCRREFDQAGFTRQILGMPEILSAEMEV